MMPLRSRGSPDGLCASWLARSDGLPHVLFLRRPLDEREADLVQAGGHLDARRHHALVELFARDRLVLRRRLVVLLAADRRGEDLLAVDGDDELMRRLVPFDADEPFGHGLQQPSREHVLAVGRERDDGPACRRACRAAALRRAGSA